MSAFFEKVLSDCNISERFCKYFCNTVFERIVYTKEKFYIRRNNNKANSLETGDTGIAHLLP